VTDGRDVFYYENNEAFEELADGESPIFESRMRFLIFAASVGYSRDRTVDDPDKDNAMRWSYINGDQKLSVITKALAYAVTEDPEVILDPDRQMNVLREYGAGGAQIINREVVDEPGDNLDNLVDFLQQHRDTEEMKDRIGVLEEIEREISGLRSDD
jgi:dnd system-associated protein 4